MCNKLLEPTLASCYLNLMELVSDAKDPIKWDEVKASCILLFIILFILHPICSYLKAGAEDSK